MGRDEAFALLAGKGGRNGHLYTLEVFLVGGPVSRKFSQKNKEVSRAIQIRGDQMLAALHRVIFDAFDREEEHLYEFQLGGKGPMDPKARRYGLSMPADDPFADEKPAGDVKRTTIGSLNLKVNDMFGYWFDFGDDWWHQINVAAIEESTPKGKYPKVIKRVGESPPQYPEE